MSQRLPSVIVGSDHIGLPLKNLLRDHLRGRGFQVDDAGTNSADPIDYPDIALAVAEDVATGNHDRGILICGTGIGMAIAANKVPGIRAATIADPYSAGRAAKSNDAQIVTLGSLSTGAESAKILVEAFLMSEFAGGRSTEKVAKISRIEERYRHGRPSPSSDEDPEHGSSAHNTSESSL